jgi:L-amino acid N-acyltransferase YncA
MQKYLDQKNKIGRLSVRLANQNDFRFTLDLYNKNVIKKKFFSKKVVSLNNHKLWFKNKLKEKMLFICSSKSRVGYIRYDRLNKNSLSVSIAIQEKYKRNGFGKIMLKKTLTKKQIIKNNIYAIVKNNNVPSKKFFLSNDFKLTNKNVYIIKAKKNERIY